MILVDEPPVRDQPRTTTQRRSKVWRAVFAAALVVVVVTAIVIRLNHRAPDPKPSRPGALDVLGVSCSQVQDVSGPSLLAIDITVHVESQYPVGVRRGQGMHLGVAYEGVPLLIDQQRSHVGARGDHGAYAFGGDVASGPLGAWIDRQKQQGHNVLLSGIEFWSRFRSATQHVVFETVQTFAPTTFWLGLFDVDGSAFTTSVKASCHR